jgi:DNA processing protein
MSSTALIPYQIEASELLGLERLRDKAEDSLWMLGDTACLNLHRIAIVGARSCSSYGRSVARNFAREFAANGCTIISGLARGVDGEAHRGALEQGTTVAVMGCGIDRVYPHAHSELWREIAEHGCVISEYGPGVEPAPWRFPARNRIIAGLADAVLVVEARERSGALITADFALEMGVPVFAVPGEITNPIAHGTNDLLRRGVAKIVTCPQDVLEKVLS